jgi:GMP synthase (glutamine-hydrolysing)
VIAILDFGSQYTRLIARAIRQLGVYSAILPASTTLAELKAAGAVGVILSGGPASVADAAAPRCDPSILAADLPLLGICYGMQLLCRDLGGAAAPGPDREYGRATIRLAEDASPLFDGLDPVQTVWMSHGDRVERLPEGWIASAWSEGNGDASRCDSSRRETGTLVAARDTAARRFVVQFHPEVAHTTRGREILSNFLFKICVAAPTWTPTRFIDEAVAAIRDRVGDERVILGVSGGVDSTVAAVLIRRAIGDRLIPVFVDNGLLRRNERAEVEERFRAEIGLDLRVVDAADRFIEALRGETDPEAKRRIIGRTFVEAFAEALRSFGGEAKFLGQGTLYPDVIESTAPSGAPSATIKTHHNVGGLPPDLKFDLLEPLRLLFKDDVRRVGLELGIDPGMIGRHPFPGPGLAVRILGEVTRERLEILRRADAIFIEELRRFGWYDRVAQALAVLLPVRSVGVMGDARTYEEVIALRAVTTEDFMTADWAVLPPDLLGRVSNRVINEVRGVNRVVYDISSKPPATIEWE